MTGTLLFLSCSLAGRCLCQPPCAAARSSWFRKLWLVQAFHLRMSIWTKRTLVVCISISEISIKRNLPGVFHCGETLRSILRLRPLPLSLLSQCCTAGGAENTGWIKLVFVSLHLVNCICIILLWPPRHPVKYKTVPFELPQQQNSCSWSKASSLLLTPSSRALSRWTLGKRKSYNINVQVIRQWRTTNWKAPVLSKKSPSCVCLNRNRWYLVRKTDETWWENRWYLVIQNNFVSSVNIFALLK